MRICLSSAVILTLLASSAAAQTAYLYSGDPFTSATGTYSVGGQVTGTFTTASPLPASLPYTGITVLRYSFSSGVHTFTPENSEVCGFVVATDGSGNITRWYISFQSTNPGNYQHMIFSEGNADEGSDSATSGLRRIPPCTLLTFETAGSESPGTWVSAAALGRTVPALNGLSLTLLTALLAAIALVALRR
jgi:hypothetical protein